MFGSNKTPAASSSAGDQQIPVVSLLLDYDYGRESLRRGFRLSAGAHAAITVVVLLVGLVFRKEPVRYIPSIRVDIFGLPVIKKGDLKDFEAGKDLGSIEKKLKENALTLKKQSKEIPVDEPDSAMAVKKVKPKEVEKRNRSAIDRLRALSELEDEAASKASAKKGKGSKAQAKGNTLSKGTSLTGGVGNDTNAFIGALQSKVRDNWNLPIWLSRQNLSAQVMVFLDSAGGVSNTVFVKDSGSKQFNDYVLKSIKSAQPFGTPPDDLVGTGITLGFPL